MGHPRRPSSKLSEDSFSYRWLTQNYFHCTTRPIYKVYCYCCLRIICQTIAFSFLFPQQSHQQNIQGSEHLQYILVKIACEQTKEIILETSNFQLSLKIASPEKVRTCWIIFLSEILRLIQNSHQNRLNVCSILWNIDSPLSGILSFYTFLTAKGEYNITNGPDFTRRKAAEYNVPQSSVTKQNDQTSRRPSSKEDSLSMVRTRQILKGKKKKSANRDTRQGLFPCEQ